LKFLTCGNAGLRMVRYRKRATTMTAREPHLRQQPKRLDAGILQAEISSFALRLAAEGKAAKTIRTYTEAVQWFAAAHLPGLADRASWEQLGSQDIQQWMASLLDRYSSAYASNQYRALQQFFRWLAGEEEIHDPMAGLKPPHVPDKPVPIFHDQDLASIERTCAGRTFGQRRDAAVIAVLRATGIRAGEITRIRYCPDDPGRSDVDLQNRTIRVRGKGRRERVVPIGHDAARALDRYLRVRSRRGAKKAVGAVAASILTAAYHMLTNGTSYQDLGANYFDQRAQAKHVLRLVNRLQNLGFAVQITPTTA